MIYATEIYAGNHKFILTIENKGDKVELNVTISTPSGWKATAEKLELVKGVSNLVCWIFCLLPFFTAHVLHISGEALVIPCECRTETWENRTVVMMHI